MMLFGQISSVIRIIEFRLLNMRRNKLFMHKTKNYI